VTPLDPAGWSWLRLAALGAAWIAFVALGAALLLARAMEHAKQTTGGDGEFITVLPYGTRHLALGLLLALLPPALALLRKLVSG